MENCRNKDGKKIWVKKGTVVRDKEGSQQVGVIHKVVVQKEPIILVHNSFHVLNEDVDFGVMERQGSSEVQAEELEEGRCNEAGPVSQLVDKGKG